MSAIKLLPHLFPCSTGQAPWRVLSSPIPDRSRFHQNAAEPFLGQRVTPARVKTVAPPASTSDNYIAVRVITCIQQLKYRIFYPANLAHLIGLYKCHYIYH